MSAYGSAPSTARITATEDLINTNTVEHLIGDLERLVTRPCDLRCDNDARQPQTERDSLDTNPLSDNAFMP
jgi:hypothetical protein